MPVQRLSEHCLQVRRFNVVNCYLVREDDGLTLVDTAIGAARIIVEAARQLNLPIRRILLTHAHLDHVGSVDMLRQLEPNAEILIGKRERQLLAEAARGVSPSRMTLLPSEPRTPVKGAFKKVKSPVAGTVSVGDTVGSLRALATPGHTPGHLSFLDERDGTLYAGDALVTFGELRLPFDPHWKFLLTKGATWDYASSLASARALLPLSFKRVAPGHGFAIEDAQPALERAITRASSLVKS